MDETNKQQNDTPIEIGSPQTMREVGIYLKSMDKSIAEIQVNQTRREAEEKLRHSELRSTIEKLQNGFITRSEHTEDIAGIKERLKPVEESTKDISIIRKLVYGCAGIILTTVIVALIYLVINK